ncbi:MAG TPA: type II secretion system F family protein, partial [Micavibrio sp.]
MDFININVLIIAISAMAAAASFMAVIIPLMNRSEKRERFRSVIEKKRKVLFEQTKEQSKKGYKPDDKALSASESVAAAYKVKRLLGEMGDKVRSQMLQAGYRNPSAPIKYMVSRIVLPVILVLFSMLVLAKGEKELSNSLVMAILMAAAGIGYGLPRALLKNQIQKRGTEI